MAEAGIKPGLFTRKTTGLVREVNRWDALVLNLFWINLPLGFFIIIVGPSIFPGVNLALGMAVTTLILVGPILMYALLATAMPRAGGEYVYISRIVHPAVGFVVNLGLTLTFLMITSMYAAWIAIVAAAPVFAALGSVLDSSTLTNLSTTLAEKPWQYIIGVVAIGLNFTLGLFGWRVILPVIRIVLALMLVSFTIMAILMATTDTASFAKTFSEFGSYHGVIAAAKDAGFASDTSSQFTNLLAFLPLGFVLLGLAQFPAYTGGEIKSPARSMNFSMVGGLLVAGAIATLLAALAYHAFGSDFIGSMTFLNGTDDYPKGLPAPFLFLYAVMLTHSVPLLVIISFGWFAAIFASMFVLWIVVTRNFLAYSLDRVLPDWLGYVSPRFHTPVRINALIGVVAAGILALFVWGPVELFDIQFSGALLQAVVYMITSIAAIMFASRAVDVFNAAPFRKRVGGIPIIAILGVIGLVEYSYFAYKLATVDSIGANINSGLIAIGVLFFIGVPIYIISYLVQKRRGVDITMAFRELPPE